MSIYLNLRDISYTYPTQSSKLFDSVNLSFYPGWCAIAGANGCGKTTLCSLMSGDITPDGGNILTNATNIIRVLQEESELPYEVYSLFYSDDNSIKRIFSLLEVKDEHFERYDTLSGGEKKRIQIAIALASEPDILIVDEPTNHLDSKSKEILRRGLKSFEGIGILITHDREFADSLVNRTLFMEKTQDSSVSISDFPLNLSAAIDENERNKSFIRDCYRTKLEKLSCLNSLLAKEMSKVNPSRLSKKNIDSKDHDAKGKIDAARLSGKDRSVTDKIRHIGNRITSLNEDIANNENIAMRKRGFSIVEKDGYVAPIVIEKGEEKRGKFTLSFPSFELKKGDKVSISGENGSGKSILMSIIFSKIKPDECIYIPQELSDSMRMDLNRMFFDVDKKEKGEILSTFFRLGSEVSALNDIENLSPGEVKKLFLSYAITKGVHYILLDEITNHLDISSMVQIEDVFSKELSNSILVFITHDEHFRKKLATREIRIEKDSKDSSIVLVD